MQPLLKALLRVVKIIWTKGNKWIRIALAVVLLYPVILIGLTTMGLTPSTISWMAFMLALIGMSGIAFVWIDPMLIALIAAFDSGRVALRALSTVVAVELFMAFYLGVLPVGSNRVFIPLMGLALLMILFSGFALGKKAEGVLKFIRFVGFVTVIALSLLTLPGGDKVQAKISVGWNMFFAPASVSQKTADQIADTLYCDDGRYIPLSRGKTVRFIVMSREDTTSFSDEEDYDDGGCWTAWLTIPEKVRGDRQDDYRIDVSGAIDMEAAYRDGTKEVIHDFDPLTKRYAKSYDLSGVRFQNNGVRPVLVELTIR